MTRAGPAGLWKAAGENERQERLSVRRGLASTAGLMEEVDTGQDKVASGS